jgi:hypothetical protein
MFLIQIVFFFSERLRMQMLTGLFRQGLPNSARWNSPETSSRRRTRPKPSRPDRHFLRSHPGPCSSRRPRAAVQQAQTEVGLVAGQCQGQVGERAEHDADRFKVENRRWRPPRRHRQHSQLSETEMRQCVGDGLQQRRFF